MTYVVDLGETSLKQRLFELGERLHDGVVLGHDRLKARREHTQVLCVGVAQQLSRRRRKFEVEWLSRQVVDLAQEEQQAGVEVDVHGLRSDVLVFVVVLSKLNFKRKTRLQYANLHLELRCGLPAAAA